ISRDLILNIELKSGNVSDDAIRNQLIQNRYYLSTLGSSMSFFTYISEQNRLVRLSNSGRLLGSSFEELASVLIRQGDCLEIDIEELFKAEKYLISPVTNPGRFLRHEYFLTSQQRDIKKQILRNIAEGHMLQGFTGIPGTGKTILLYDIAMQLSQRNPVCVLHFGPHRQELRELDERLKRIDFYYCSRDTLPEIPGTYAAIFVDEGHGLGADALTAIREKSRQWHAPIIVAYDNVDCVSKQERIGIGAPVLEADADFRSFRLTNRIRLNHELSSFLRILFKASVINKRDYPNVSVTFGNDQKEAGNLILGYERDGYMFIWDRSLLSGHDITMSPLMDAASSTEAGLVTGKEYDKVVMMLDDTFYYDANGFLRNQESDTAGPVGRIMNLFHGLSRAKERIALVILKNEKLLEQIYRILQK
ncbi:MAG: ATP-binding protein, partial [Lachnospiraceae bacterium]|nr:ATP-binding protein [Lachnospiraceae bacterium]